MISDVARNDARRLPALAGQRIDRRGATPFYHQLKEILLGTIGSGWVAGDKLPSESELCLRFGVSRTVVRQALDEMEREGLVYKIKGKGAFVTGQKFDASFAQRAAGFHESMTSRGHVVRSQILAQDLIPASVHVARVLELDVDEPVVAVDRVRSVDGVPIQVVRAWMPHRLCPGLEDVDLRDASLYAVLERRYGLRPHHGWRTIEAIAMSEADAARLSVAPASPALLVVSVTRTEAGVPFEHFSAVYRGDRSRFDIQVMSPEDGR
jgi:GntR family transcriptional regulator, N-acetylglucosamine utilization regulator